MHASDSFVIFYFISNTSGLHIITAAVCVHASVCVQACVWMCPPACERSSVPPSFNCATANPPQEFSSTCHMAEKYTAPFLRTLAQKDKKTYQKSSLFDKT